MCALEAHAKGKNVMVKPLVFVALFAFAASAQSRGPVVPNFQEPEKQAVAPAPAAARADDSIDLVGPTDAQKQRAKDAAAALAKADAEAKAAAEKKAKDESAGKAKAEAAARLAADQAAEKKLRDENDARLAAEKKVRDEAEQKARAEAAAKLAAETKAREASEALAREDAEKRAKLDAELAVKAEAAAKAQAELALAEKTRRDSELAAQLKAKSEAVEKARAEADAQAKAQAEAQAARKQTFADAQARAKAAADEAKKKALEAALAKKLADAEARAAARAVFEAKKAEATEKAHAKSMLAQRKREEAKCGRGKKADGCLDAVAARFGAPGLLPPASAVAAAAAPAIDPMAIAPLVPASGERRVLVPSASGAPVVALSAAPVSAVPAVYPAGAPAPAQKASAAPGSQGVVVAVASQPLSAAQPAAFASSRGFVAVPRDEAPQHRARALQVDNQLQVGPDSLILDRLEARGELMPGALQLDFGYRFAIDDAAAAHHLFSVGLESGSCLAGDACGARWFLRGGFGPRSSANYAVSRKIGTTVGNHTDSLGWSANILQAGAGFTGATVSFLADAQLEALSAEYLRNVDQAGPLRESGDLKQVRLRGTVGVVNGPWSAQARVAGYLYAGADPATLKDVPLRGALIDDELPGLAGAPQSLSARLEGGWEAPTGTSLRLSYGYLSYAGPVWSSANLFAGGLSQKVGHFRLGGGVVVEQEQDSKGNSYPTVFGTVTLGASF